MAINYVVTKKVDTTKGETNVRYYATTRALQKKPVDSAEIARQLAEKSSLQDGDVMSVLVQLSGVIAEHLHQGRTVSIDGLGNFFPTITSKGVEKPEECTADKVWVARTGISEKDTDENQVSKHPTTGTEKGKYPKEKHFGEHLTIC